MIRHFLTSLTTPTLKIQRLGETAYESYHNSEDENEDLEGLYYKHLAKKK
jgi:hypothetical protein